MPRILLLTYEFSPFRGGIGNVAEGLAEGAEALGHEPVVFAPDYHGDRSSEDGERPYRVVRFPGDFCSIVSLPRLVRFVRLCRSAIATLRPDVVHGVDPPAQMALTALSRLRLVSRYLLTVHGTELLRYRSEPMPRLWMAGGLRRATAVCAVSRAVHERLHRDFRVPPDRTFVSSPGIADAWFRTPGGDRDALRATWGAGAGDVVVLTVARRVFEKGQDRVVDALALLSEAERRHTLYVVAGTGPEGYADELRARAQEGGVRLVLLGPVPEAELVGACDAADLFAMLSRDTPKRLEGLGLTYLEAGARGLPSLACDVGGVSDAVRNGESGIVLDADAGPEDVAAAVRGLVADPDLLKRLGRGAAEHARSFTRVRHASEVYGRFEETLRRGG